MEILLVDSDKILEMINDSDAQPDSNIFSETFGVWIATYDEDD